MLTDEMKNHGSHLAKFCSVFLVCGLILSSGLIFLNLGKGSIDLWDESITAGRSLYIYENHSTINLEVNGEKSIRKPPLMYILNALSFGTIGVNELGLRFPNALFGLACFFVVSIAVNRLGGVMWASLAPWLLLGSFSLIEISREALTDTVFAIGFLCASVALIFEYTHNKSLASKWRWFYALGLFLVLFGKGPIGLFLPIYVITFLLLSDKKIALNYLFPTIVACVPFVVWILIQWYSERGFLSIFIGQEYFERLNYNSSFLPAHIRGPFWYIEKLWYYFRLTGYLSIIFSLISLVVIVIRKQYSRVDSKVIIFLFGLAMSYLLLISIASHKQSRYLLPVLTLLTILLPFSCRFLCSYLKSRFWRYSVVVCILLSIIVGLHTTARHYRSVPDYQASQKAVSLSIIPYAAKDLPVYTNDDCLAITMHFYVQKRVKVVASLKHIPSVAYVFVSKSPIANGLERSGYYIVVAEENKNAMKANRVPAASS